MNLDDVLASATPTKSVKDKSKALEVPVTDAKVVKKIDTWLESSKQVDLHRAKMESSKDDILEFANRHHLAHVNETNSVPATVKLVIPTGSLSIDLAKNQYGKIDRATAEPGLKEVFGDNFDKCFTSKRSISLTPAALADNTLLETLVKAVGPENFKKYFEVQQVLVPTAVMHEGRFLDPAIKVAFNKASEEKLITPFAASFKG